MKVMTKPEWRKLDKLAAQKCKDDAGWRCEVCGRDGVMHWHHYFSRRHTSTRWILPNLLCVCPACHKMSPWSFHEHPEWGRQKFIDLRGEDYLKKLESLTHKINKFDFETNKEMMEWNLEEILEKYSKSV